MFLSLPGCERLAPPSIRLYAGLTAQHTFSLPCTKSAPDESLPSREYEPQYVYKVSKILPLYVTVDLGSSCCTDCCVAVLRHPVYDLAPQVYTLLLACCTMMSKPQKNSMLKKLRDRVDSWVMLDETTGFVPLPKERVLFTSPQRTTLAIQTPNSYPGKEPLAIHSSAGTAFLTNQRVGLLICECFRAALIRSHSAACVSTGSSHSTSQILLRTHHEPTRRSCSRTLLRRQRLDRYTPTGYRRWHSTTSRICGDQNDIQRGRSI